MLTPCPLEGRGSKSSCLTSFVQTQGPGCEQTGVTKLSEQLQLVTTMTKMMTFQIPAAIEGRSWRGQPCPSNHEEARKRTRVKDSKFLIVFQRVWDDDPPAAPAAVAERPSPRRAAGERSKKTPHLEQRERRNTREEFTGKLEIS